MEKMYLSVLKPVSPFIGGLISEVIKQINDKLKEKEKK